MILVAASSLWCSSSVRGAGLRIEVMRFALLIVLTAGLLSVAFRINGHPSVSAHRHTPLPHASPTTPTSVLPTARTRPPRTPSTTSGGGRGQPGGSGTSATPGATGRPTLPVTGWDEAVKLGALALLMIGGGTLAMRAGAPRRQPGSTVQD